MSGVHYGTIPYHNKKYLRDLKVGRECGKPTGGLQSVRVHIIITFRVLYFMHEIHLSPQNSI